MPSSRLSSAVVAVTPSSRFSSAAVEVTPSRMFSSAAVEVTPSRMLSSAVVAVTPSSRLSSAAVEVTPSRMFSSAVVLVNTVEQVQFSCSRGNRNAAQLQGREVTSAQCQQVASRIVGNAAISEHSLSSSRAVVISNERSHSEWCQHRR